MKPGFTPIALLIFFQLIACCNKSGAMAGSSEKVLHTDRMKMKITVGRNTFMATLYNNATVTAYITLLPMTINMSELNANEKFFDLRDQLPANASNPGTIQAGDLMMYGSNTLVIFYKSFLTSYNYTKLGRINNSSGLAAALGSGGVTVMFELVQ